jgi:hypothetical protein
MQRTFVVVLIAACGKPSFRDSIAALCDADGGPKVANLNPAARQAAVQGWLEDHIRNQDGKDFVAVIVGMRPWMRRHQILRTAEDQHIDNCKPIAALAGMRSPLGIDVPDITGLDAGSEPLDDVAPFIAMTGTAVEIDTRPFPLDADGFALASRAIRNRTAHDPIQFATVAAARTTTCAQLFPVLDVAHTGGISSVRLVVTAGEADRTVAIDLPKASAGGNIDSPLVLASTQLVGPDLRVELTAGRDALRGAIAKLPAGTLSLICEPDATLDALAAILAAAAASHHDARFGIRPREPLPKR